VGGVRVQIQRKENEAEEVKGGWGETKSLFFPYQGRVGGQTRGSGKAILYLRYPHPSKGLEKKEEGKMVGNTLSEGGGKG